MSIRVALHHTTHYRYERPIQLGPQVIRLRPAAHTRTPVPSYSLTITPKDHFLNWQQDPHGNFLARLVFPNRIREFRVDVDLVAEMTVINPFDFFLEPDATEFPFVYSDADREQLTPYLEKQIPGRLLSAYLQTVDYTPRRTIDFLVDLNRKLQSDIEYVIRLEPGVQSSEETLSTRRGSCRDSALLLVEVLRHLGLASRFTSGYLIQLKPDEKPLEGPAGAAQDFTDLHAWTEVYLPGAGWIGLDPTSGLLTGEGHIPLASTPHPQSAAPISGLLEPCETEFHFEMNITRIHEDPRVTKPYSDEQWSEINALGSQIDRRLQDDDVRLTMGGEPTFVSIDDMQGDEWRTAALGVRKREMAFDLLLRLRQHFAPGGLLHLGQGKWYPGETLPRWAFRCYWRTDGEPIWRDIRWLADDRRDYGHTASDARHFGLALAERLQVDPRFVQSAYEDVFYYMWKERRLPPNVDLHDNKLEDPEERRRVARVFEQGITSSVGSVLPLRHQAWGAQPGWKSGWWPVRSDQLFLIPGDSPIGFRLPLQSLRWSSTAAQSLLNYSPDPLAQRDPLPPHDQIRQQMAIRQWQPAARAWDGAPPWAEQLAYVGATMRERDPWQNHFGTNWPATRDTDEWSVAVDKNGPNGWHVPSDGVVRTALCIEARQGRLHIFIPPLDHVEAYLDLVTAIEDTARELQLPVVLEGYLPPTDHRLRHLSVTPDPGVIEVNVPPAHDWSELLDITQTVYQEARQSRLGTEKFDRDGLHTGTGGGNHVVLGGPTPADSPFLRRPDLLRSLIGFWNNHPSLSYLFCGRFIGPTSQAPRVDEGRRDSLYELQIAFEQIPEQGHIPPWLVDRIFRHILVDGTGNTHRAEFCIDKLFSPDSSSGRLGLLEFRAFEMPPHYRMSMTQQLLMRALLSHFWRNPFRQTLVAWNTALHDRYLLPHFIWEDFCDVLRELQTSGISLDPVWFAPHFEFRFPKVGEFTCQSVHVELRQAIEPWYVLGEEAAAGGTTRFVDSSVERMQVRVRAMTDPRYVVTCNGRRVPLHPTGTSGEFVAGIRYRAWQPPSCLHPTIPVDDPLVFDLLDTWAGRSLGGCRYHVGHPGGLNPETFPVNSYEAESRRATRFFRMGHTGGPLPTPPLEPNAHFPLTLDLRYGKSTVLA